MIQAILAPHTVVWVIPIRDALANYRGRVTTWALLSVIVVPVFLGLGAGWATDKLFNPAEDRARGKFANFVNRIAPAPTPPTIWDWLFKADRFLESGFLVVEFDDGKRIAGAFAKESLALTSPEPHGLFLEREWQFDKSGNVASELPGTAGILIPSVDNVRWCCRQH